MWWRYSRQDHRRFIKKLDSPRYSAIDVFSSNTFTYVSSVNAYVSMLLQRNIRKQTIGLYNDISRQTIEIHAKIVERTKNVVYCLKNTFYLRDCVNKINCKPIQRKEIAPSMNSLNRSEHVIYFSDSVWTLSGVLSDYLSALAKCNFNVMESRRRVVSG